MTEDKEYRKKPHVMATDGNYLMQRANAAYRELAISEDQHSGIVYGYINYFCSYLTKYRPDYMIPLFDNGRSSYRTSINSDYKSNRPKKSDDMMNQMNACREFMTLAGWTPYVEKNVEADDLAAKVAKELEGDYFIELLSPDHDWRQLTSESVIVIKPGTKGKGDEYINYDKATEMLGFPAERWAEIAAIAGDPGDGVIGLPRYGYGRSIKLLNKWGDLWTACNNEPILKENASRVLSNWKMTVLDGTVPSSDIPLEQNRVEDVREKIYDNKAVLDFCDRWHLVSFKKKILERSLY